MKEGYIAVIDSGIGGLSVLNELIKELPNEKYIYYGDNYNAPYGNRSTTNLLDLTVNIINELSVFKLKAIVLGCNTLSVTILERIKYYFPNLKIYGVFPPVEILTLRKRKTLLLCTPNTSKLYKDTNYLTVLPMQKLANDIEKNVFNLDLIDIENHVGESVNSLRNSLTTSDTTLTTKKEDFSFEHQKGRFNVIILGCTHYFFVKNKIFNHFQPQLIVRGETFTAKKISKEFQYFKTSVKHKQNKVLFYGKCSFYNKKVFDLLMDNNSKCLKKLQIN